MKLRYRHRDPRSFPTLGFSFPNSNNNIVEVEDRIGEKLLIMKTGSEHMFEKVGERRKKDEEEIIEEKEVS